MTGFSFNGIHCSTYGLYYIPSADDKWFADPEYEVYDADISWKDGGYYFGSKLKNRTFTIKCYFEEIDLATRQRIKQWVKRGTRGRLVFDDIPFAYWNVVPGKIPVGNWYYDTGDTHSGTVTITFTAYEPFGYLMRKSNGASDGGDGSEAYCNFINSSEMPDAPTTSSTAFDIYNPGTEDCGLTIDIYGSTSNPFRFYNDANGTYCIINSLPTTSGNHLIINGDTGNVAEYHPPFTGHTTNFVYHDKGFVTLLPNYKMIGIEFTYENSFLLSHIITLPSSVEVTSDMKYSIITIDGVSDTTLTVAAVNKNSNSLTCYKTGDGTIPSSGVCNIKKINHIVIQEKGTNGWVAPTTLSLASISVDYNPRIS